MLCVHVWYSGVAVCVFLRASLCVSLCVFLCASLCVRLSVCLCVGFCVSLCVYPSLSPSVYVIIVVMRSIFLYLSIPVLVLYEEIRVMLESGGHRRLMIDGDVVAPISADPFVVSLLQCTVSGGSHFCGKFCSGFLIAANVVLTAGHCTHDASDTPGNTIRATTVRTSTPRAFSAPETSTKSISSFSSFVLLIIMMHVA